MTILLFLIILVLLILVHELGHFLAAKKAGVKVEEFGIGFPPRLWSFRRGETVYSLNLLPFGGFVKIFGETVSEEATFGPERERSLANKPKLVQAAVLLAGVTFNLLLAWLLLIIGLTVGLPASSGALPGVPVEESKLLIVGVLPNSPAQQAGLKTGDELVFLGEPGRPPTLERPLEPADVQSFIAAHPTQEIILGFRRGEETGEVAVKPVSGLAAERATIGILLDRVGLIRLSLFPAIVQGARLTAVLTARTVEAVSLFIVRAFQGEAVIAEVAGPIGLAGLVSEAAGLGFSYLLLLTAFISINLAIINLIPFPALDGGRILFLAVETVKGSPIKPAVANTLNLIGFALLILLMLTVTYNDLLRIFSLSAP